MSSNLFPNSYINKQTKLLKLNQHNLTVWLTGLSGSGKSTIAKLLEQALFDNYFLAAVLDGDNLRTGLCSDLSFTEADRTENVRRTAETANILLNNGFIVIVALISPLASMRELAKTIIGAENFVEIFIDAPLSVCADRDVKGLYKKAQNMQIDNFTAVSQPYQTPVAPFLVLNTVENSPQASADYLYQKLLPFVKI